MAFVDRDEYGERFVNVDARTGATGAWNDLLAVQAMLYFLYGYHALFREKSPLKGAPSVTGKPAKDTAGWIVHFKNFYLRDKPHNTLPYVDPASGKKKAGVHHPQDLPHLRFLD